MSTLAVLGMLFTGSMSETVSETTVAPEDCEHNISMVYDEENSIHYDDEFYADLYSNYYAYTNYCEECDWNYYKYCACDYEEYFNDEYHDDEFCSCGAYHYCDDYLAFVNDYVDYESNCTEECEGCGSYYYDHCCDEFCDFNVYYMDLQYLEMIQEESIAL